MTDCDNNVTQCISDCEKAGGKFSSADKNCYTYWILDRLCLKVDFEKTVSVTKMNVLGGCFEDDEPGYYI